MERGMITFTKSCVLHAEFMFQCCCCVLLSISAQSNFAVGAVVNATFGSITEMTFYITALLRGHRAGSNCYEEIVKSALAGTLIGCILFIPVSVTEGHVSTQPPACLQV